MALIACPECGKEVSDRAFSCPNCGCPISAAQNATEDNSKKISNLYDRARKSLEVDDLEHAAEYYKEILDINPDDWEAYFYSYLGETTSFTNAQAGSVASKLGKTIPEAYDMAVNSDDADEISRRVKLISEKTSDRLLNIALTGKLLLQEHENGNLITIQGKVNRDMYNKLRPTAQNTIASCAFAFDSLVEKIEALSADEKIDKETRKESLKKLLSTRLYIAEITFSPALGLEEKMITDEYIQRYAKQLQNVDSDATASSILGGMCELSIFYTSNLGGSLFGLYTINSDPTKRKIKKGETKKHIVNSGECTITFHYQFKKFTFTVNIEDSVSLKFKCKSFAIELEQ